MLLTTLFLNPAQIVSFNTLGAKNYAITSKTKDGRLVTECKVRGFSLKSFRSQESLNGKVITNYLDDLLQKKTKSVAVNQFKISVDPRTRKLFSVITSRVYKNNPLTKRVMLQKYDPPVYQTLPFGYNQTLLDEHTRGSRKMD